MVKKIFNLSSLVLLTALALSAIAAWYSILGLTAIFAAAVMPIIIMGGSLEFAKVVTTVWLHRHWDKISWQMKSYLVPAVVALAFLTSMGIFGFLSKAHMDQGVPTGDIAAKVSLIDEKIKTQRENIDISRKALSQMDAQVDQRLSRSDNENGVDKAVVIRKQQAKERASLQNDIALAQKEIAKLNEERAPIASELRKVEAEVGPIKYIAALIYGDNPDQNVLERAVRWVIILIVFVFDPLALTLVIASNTSRKWDVDDEVPVSSVETESKTEEVPPKQDDNIGLKADIPHATVAEEKHELLEKFNFDAHPYLFNFPTSRHPPGIEPCPPMVGKSVTETTEVEPEVKLDVLDVEPRVEDLALSEITGTVDATTPIVEPEIETDGVTKQRPYKEMGNGYVSFEGKQIHIDALKQMHPELFKLSVDHSEQANNGFGTQFPRIANKGDTFVRVDMLPNRVYKFDGVRWIQVAKENSDLYLQNKTYLQFLISKIDRGEYDIDTLSDVERSHLEEYLRSQNS